MAERSLAEKAYRYIYDQLATGQLKPGDRLVNRVLADEIGVSVIPVREAIHRLASEGLVQHIPGAGASVPDRSQQDLNNLYVLRDALESCAAEEAARHIRDEQLELLAEILGQMKKIERTIACREIRCASESLMKQWLTCEEQFHNVLVESSRNELLVKVIREHRAVSRVFDVQRNEPGILSARVASRTCRDRAALLQALADHKPEESRRLMSQQIREGRKTVLTHRARRPAARSSPT